MTGRQKVIAAAEANGWAVAQSKSSQNVRVSKGRTNIYVGISMSGVILEASGNYGPDRKGQHLLGSKKADQLVAILNGSSN